MQPELRPGINDMGISRGAVELLAMTLQGALKRERVVTFGVQRIQAKAGDIRHILDKHSIYNHPCDGSPNDVETVSQTTLFQLLGYGSVESIDFYPDEGPSLVLDLNLPLPPNIHANFDLVYDGGTMEHCFDPAQVLRNAASLVAPAGVVIHHVPMNNWVDHGFYQFCPTLLFDFYEASGFIELKMKIHFMSGGKESYVDYDPACDPPIPYAFGGNKKVLAFFSAKRGPSSHQILLTSLIQGRYRATFGGQASLTRGGRKGLMQRLRSSARKRFFGWNAKRL
jgi:SAM-dependent methyltransferase